MDINTKYHFRNNFFDNPKYYNDLILFQIGEALCEITAEVNNHLHLDWYEFSYIISGKGVIFTNNIGTSVKKGDLYFSFPQEIHRITSDNIEPLRYIFVAFNFLDSSPLKPLLEKYKKIAFSEKKRVYNSNSLLTHFQHLLFGLGKDSLLHDLTFEYEFKTVLLKVFDIIESDDSKTYLFQRKDHHLLCFNIMNYIDNNITSIDGAMTFSEVFGYNYTYLSRFFKKITGENISTYITNKKLFLAKEMLSSSDTSITEIANQLHYSSIHVFSRAFKNKFKISPIDYRRAALSKKH